MRQLVTATKKNGGRSTNINSCAINKHCACRQFRASNPPLLLAANRYSNAVTVLDITKVSKKQE